jgi:hypothetical protein
MGGLTYPVDFFSQLPDQALNRVLVFRQQYPRW